MNAEIESYLATQNQQHLLKFLETLSVDQRFGLLEQIAAVDFPLVNSLFKKFGKEDQWAELARKATPPVALRLDDNGTNPVSRKKAVQCGEEALKAGKVGLIMVAGGQGSRLGFEHPKGMYPLGPVTNRTLFQIHIDKLKALNTRHSTTIPFYVMTSPATDQETRQFLDDNQWFGYPKDAVKVFCQGTMPAVDYETGKVLLAEKHSLFSSPDGHGGTLAAMHSAGCLDDMKQRGLQQLFYCQVDNPLCQICDAATIGYHILCESEVSSQAVPKAHPLQKVGNLVAIDGKVRVIEYSDLPEQVAVQTDDAGQLKLWAGSIAVHVFNVEFLDRMTEQADALPFHLAHKKVPFIDDSGNRVSPNEPNAIKFERFIFDLLPMASHSIVIEVSVPDAFSPVKNAATEDNNTAATAQKSMIEQASRLLEGVGVKVADGIAVELEPLLYLDNDRLKQAVEGLREINEPVFLR